ncbi:myo-inosose-2 dehydratase [Rubellimicrobium sp. CFH 75288]|uniref:myo-inosose-2 dehydratase n=1 Tax=Rubellimicrobium sp. CFH 75288 TaxID=2697034 RepID=UPI00352B5602
MSREAEETVQARLGIAPIAWWNDDLPDLSDDVSLEECLRQAAEAGYCGMETGRRFPMDPAVLKPVLDQHGMQVCGGWFSGRLLDGSLEEEKDRVRAQLDLFRATGAPCLIYGETARSIQGDRTVPLARKPRIDKTEMRAYGRKLTAFAEWCAEQGVPLSYHHHMAAVVETEEEIDALMMATGEALGLLYDAGHLAFAGGDVLALIDRHAERINHVHAKDVRLGVVHGIDRERESFLDAVVKGAFTVPGDGDLDFAAILGRLARNGYQGWFVVEAEQDPRQAPPAQMARIGWQELTRLLRAAGYSIETG